MCAHGCCVIFYHFCPQCLYPYTVSVSGGPGEGGIHCSYNETGLTGTSMIANCQSKCWTLHFVLMFRLEFLPKEK